MCDTPAVDDFIMIVRVRGSHAGQGPLAIVRLGRVRLVYDNSIRTYSMSITSRTGFLRLLYLMLSTSGSVSVWV